MDSNALDAGTKGDSHGGRYDLGYTARLRVPLSLSWRFYYAVGIRNPESGSVQVPTVQYTHTYL